MEFLIATSIFGGASMIDEHDIVHEINKFALVRDIVCHIRIKF